MATSALRAQDVAKYFLANVDEEEGDNITHLKLQKLLYYAQGFHLAMQEGTPLFPESVLRWPHGPAVQHVWLKYRDYGSRPIAPPADYHEDDYLPEVREILAAVFSTYGQFTASKLCTMTHNEPPWRDTLPRRSIDPTLMQDYFSTLVEAGRQDKPVAGHPLWPTKSFKHQRRKEIASRLAVHSEKLRSVVRRAPGRGDLL